MTIFIAPGASIHEDELNETFVRSSGPGGQNVNKLSTATQLRFDLRGSPGLPFDLKLRAAKLAGRRLTNDGVIVIVAQTARTQERNRAEALRRLVELLQEAAKAPVRRRATRPGAGALERRKQAKQHQAKRKTQRKPIAAD